MKRILVCPDTHVPYHDIRHWELFLRVLEREKPTHLVFIGDFADFYSISRHSKDPRRIDRLEMEVDIVNSELDKVRAEEVIFIEGNHEDRLRRYLQDKAPELFGLTSPRRLFRIDERGWRYFDYRSVYRLGRVYFTHDVGRSGKYAIQQSLTDFGGNLVFGHTHRGGVHYAGEIKGKTHFCLNVGWLGDVTKIDYMHQALARREWQDGFGIVDIDEIGNAYAQFIPIIKGRCLVNGRLYRP